jgi:hypothetical protein
MSDKKMDPVDSQILDGGPSQRLTGLSISFWTLIAPNNHPPPLSWTHRDGECDDSSYIFVLHLMWDTPSFFPKLGAHTHGNWQYLVTGGESGFDCQYVRDQIWTPRDENTPEVENRTVMSSKSLLIVLCNPYGFHVIAMLPSTASFNTSWFMDENLIPLVEKFFPAEWSTG